MTALLYAAIFGILRAADGNNTFSRGLILLPAAVFLTLYNTPIWWMVPVQMLGLYAIFFGGWSSLLDWAQGLPLSDPEEHKIAYWVWVNTPYSWHDWPWAITRMMCGITPICIINGAWWALPVGVIMAYCYRWAFLIRKNKDWVRWAEWSSWILLIVLFV